MAKKYLVINKTTDEIIMIADDEDSAYTFIKLSCLNFEDCTIEKVEMRYFGRSIIISIRSEWVCKILNGEKTIEVRKKFPKDYVGWVYIYCTKNIGKHGENQLLNFFKGNEYFIGKDIDNYNPNDICYLGQNGKVVARFWCDKVGNFSKEIFGTYEEPFTYNQDDLLKKTCLTEKELDNYLKGKVGYAIHISKLEVFDKPKELKEFKPYTCDKCDFQLCSHCNLQVKKAPQSYMFIED